jgi:preprotein translocase subunit SecD
MAVALVIATGIGCSGDDDSGDPGDDQVDPDSAVEEAGGEVDVAVELTFAPDTETAVPPDQLDDAIVVVERRIDALDIDGAEVGREGEAIVVGLDEEAADARDELTAAVEARGELRFRPVLQADPSGSIPVTSPKDDVADQPVGLEGTDGTVYLMGPTEATGDVVESAEARINTGGQWEVGLVLRPGAEGIGRFNEIAAACVAAQPTCPTAQLGIVLDSVVQSAPMVQESSYERDQISISGSFEEDEVSNLAAVLVAGVLPFGLELSATDDSPG